MLEEHLWISVTYTLSFCNPSSLPIGLVTFFTYEGIFWALPIYLQCKSTVSLMPILVTLYPMGDFCYLKIYNTVLFRILNLNSHFSLDCYIYHIILPPVFKTVALILSKSVGGVYYLGFGVGFFFCKTLCSVKKFSSFLHSEHLCLSY